MAEDLDNFDGEELDFDGLADDPVADLGVTREGDEDATGAILTAMREPRGVTDAPLNCRGRDRLENLRVQRGITEFLRARTAVAAAEVIVPKGATHKINKGDLEGEHFLLIKSIYDGKLLVGYIRGGKRNGREVRISPDDVLDLEGLPISAEALGLLVEKERLNTCPVVVDDNDADDADEAAPVDPIVAQKDLAKRLKARKAELGIHPSITHLVSTQGDFYGRYSRIMREARGMARIEVLIDKKWVATTVPLKELQDIKDLLVLPS